MRKQLTALLLAGVMALAACAQEATDGTNATDAPAGPVTTSAGAETTTAGADTTAAGDSETIAEFQAEIDELATAIGESAAAEELTEAWDALSDDLAVAVASIQEDGTIARAEIESGLESFQERLDELDVEENVRTAWEALRSHLEQLLS